MKVRCSPQERSPVGAKHVLGDIYRAIQFIADQPEGSERTDDPNVRVKIVRQYRYKIFYRITEDGLDILHVRHASRRPWQHLD